MGFFISRLGTWWGLIESSAFKFIKDIIEPIATEAGCFLALNEIGVYQESSSQASEGLQGFLNVLER